MLVAPELYSSDSATNGLKMIGGRFMKNGSVWASDKKYF